MRDTSQPSSDQATPDHESSSGPGRPRFGRRRLAVVVGGAAVVAVAALGLTQLGGDDEPAEREPSRNATAVPAPSGANDAVMPTTDARPQQPAATAAAAVDAYVDAEIAGDFAASWALLSLEDRDDLGSFEAWRDQHAVSPRLIFSSTVAADPADPSAPIVSDVTFEPRVDETVGVVAGSARITWATVAEGGGFAIDRTATRADANYPSDTLAAADALTWVQRVRDGQPNVGYDGSLLGQPALVGDIAASDGAFTATSTVELDDWSTPGLVNNAFGPTAGTWARVVHLDGPIPVDVVMAPYGDRWVTVGVVGT